MARVYPIYCPRGQSVSPCAISIHSVHMVSMYPTYCPYGQSVSPYIAHVTRVSHHAPYQSMVSSTWSECIQIYCPRGQSVSQCAVLIHGVHVASMYPIYCPCGRSVSPCAIPINGVHVVRVCPIYCPCGHSVSPYQFMVSMRSVCIPYIAHVVRVSHHINS